MAEVDAGDRRRQLPPWMLTAGRHLSEFESYTGKQSFEEVGIDISGKKHVKRFDKGVSCVAKMGGVSEGAESKAVEKLCREGKGFYHSGSRPGQRKRKAERNCGKIGRMTQNLALPENGKSESCRAEGSEEIDSSSCSTAEENRYPVHTILQEDHIAIREVNSDVDFHAEHSRLKRNKRSCRGKEVNAANKRPTKFGYMERTDGKQAVQEKRPPDSCEQIEEPASASEDEVILTVSDLIAIATKHVRAYEEARQKTDPDLHKSDPTSAVPLSYIESEPVSSFQDIENACGQLASAKTESSTQVKRDHPSKESISEVCRTGDPKLDMLDLFLGPLLKKSDISGKLGECGVDFSALSQPNMCEKKWNPAKDEAPLAKKKSSLKNKVALYLE